MLSAFGSCLASRIGGGSFLYSFFSTLVWAFVAWFLWSLVSYLVGTMLFGGQATLDEMLRVIGFAHAPQILAIVPCYSPPIYSAPRQAAMISAMMDNAISSGVVA